MGPPGCRENEPAPPLPFLKIAQNDLLLKGGERQMDAEKQVNEYAAMIAVLEAKKAAIEAAISSLRFLANGGPVPATISVAGPGSSTEAGSPISGITTIADIPAGAFFNKSIPEAAKIYLQMIKKKQTG